VQLVPEKREQIFERADEYVHNRLVCGVHYASDIEASRRVAYAIFGSMAASPNFQRDLAAAREEMRSKPGLSLAAPLQ
jgi:acid phosphatase (class A)